MATAIPLPQQQPNAATQAPISMPTPQQTAPAVHAAKQATETLTKAATSLPQMVGQQVQQHTQMAQIRMKQVIDTVANAHIADTAARQKIAELNPIVQQIDQHMKEAQALPDSDPQKIGKIGYLAHSHQQVVQAIMGHAQIIKTHQATVQALLAEPKNRKILSKAVGYDEKAANTPERQMMVAALKQHEQRIQQQAEQQQPTSFAHKLGTIAKTVGEIAAPEVAMMIPGSAANKEMHARKMAYQQEQQLKMDTQRASIDQKEADAASKVPLAEHQHEFDVKQADTEEKSRQMEANTQARLAQAAAKDKATEGYRKATLQFQKDKLAWESDPHNPVVHAKMLDSQSKATAAKASMIRAMKSKAGQTDTAVTPALIDAIGHGRIAAERLSYLLTRNPALLDAVVQKYPDFDGSKAASYPQAYKDFTSTKKGTAGGALLAGATALEHLQELMELNTNHSHDWFSKDYTKYKNKVDQVAGELATFYGEATIPAIEGYKSTLMTTLPGHREAAIRTQAQSMADRLANYEQAWKNAAPSRAYEKPMPNMSEKAKQALQALLGGSASPAPHTHVFSVAAWKRANPSGDANAAKAAAEQQGYQVIP